MNTHIQSHRVSMYKRVVVCLGFFALAVSANADEIIPLHPDLKVKADIRKSELYRLSEKSLVVIFPERRRVLSTYEGFVDTVAIVNHSADPQLWKKVGDEMKTKEEVGGIVYLRKVKEKISASLGVRNSDMTLIGTAANMDDLTVVTKEYKPFIVTALVTAGTKTNAMRTGIDEGKHIEGEEPKGTVNILILTNARLSDGAMARAIMTVTEAKTAAFEDLSIPSSYTKNVQATGTGTDNVIVVSGTIGPKVSYLSGHSRIGELIGKAVYDAVLEGLKKQRKSQKTKSNR